MIHIVRPPVPDEVQAAFARRGRTPDERTEIEKAREYYTQNPLPKKAFEFKRYKEFPVCRALDELFHEKCAYCESTYRAVDSRDVEHYRPKGGVTEAPKHPGYWWLAAVWNNLLPSCPACNQSRYHTVFDSGITIEEFEQARRRKPDRLSGKANSFPLLGKNWANAENDNIAAEDPLLINPCDRDPENHLEFVFDWDRTSYIWEADPINALVRPKLKAGKPDQYAQTSIAAYGLNRAGLIRERAEHLKILQLLCRPIIDQLEDLVASPSPTELTKIKNRICEYKGNLTTLTRAKRVYAGMTRAYLLRFEDELNRLAGDAA
jgi:hypothetical protein